MAVTAVVLLLAATMPQWGGTARRPRQENPPATYLKHLIGASEEEKEGEGENLPRREPREDLAELERAVNRVAVAFEHGDVDLLERYLIPSRIYISLKSRGEEAGYKGRPQIKFMFARLFSERQTREFVYDASTLELTRDGEGGIAHADWTYVVLDEDEVVTEHLRFELERTKDGWLVYEVTGGTR